MIFELYCWRPAFSRPAGALLCALSLMLTGCANTGGSKAGRYDGAGPLPPLAYAQLLSKMGPAELGRERAVLAALPATPNTHLRQAMLAGYPRAQQDLGKALALLDSVLKSSDPAAVQFHPLARLLSDNYIERARLESQLDKQGQQMKESQRKATELQEKLDSLADIERTLTPRSRTTRPEGVKR